MGVVSKVEILAEEITSLDEQEQNALWECVVELNFRRGLHDLSEQYRKRLKEQGELDHSVDEIWMDLKRIREEIAKHDYPG
jgi:hypothetical protein